MRLKKICNDAVNYCLAALKFISNWFFISKMFQMIQDALLANDDTLF